MKGLSVAVLVDPSWKVKEQLSQTYNSAFCVQRTFLPCVIDDKVGNSHYKKD